MLRGPLKQIMPRIMPRGAVSYFSSRMSRYSTSAALERKAYVGAIDQGTSSTRFVIFDKKGEIVAVDQREFGQIMPQAGWLEHNPAEIWQTTKECIAGAMEKAGLGPSALAAVGITNQRETTVVWDRRTGEPVYNALVWSSAHTQDICHDLQHDGGKDRFRAKTGLPVATYFSASKIKWILDNVPDARAKAEAGDLLFGNTDAWLIWNLTGGAAGDGVHLTDVTNASRVQLMDLATCKWDDELLSTFNIPASMLPAIRPSISHYGQCVGTAVGVPALQDVSIEGVLGDQQAALFGQAGFNVGDAKNTYGTGCFLLMNTGETAVASTKGLLTTLAYQFEGQPPVYALEGSVSIAGALVQWLRDNLKLIESAREIEAIANSVDDNGGCYFVPAFAGLYAPHWRDDARGVICGLTRFANRGHICRAALEAIAFQSAEVFRAMELDSKFKLQELKVDGGGTGNATLMQFQADILDRTVVRPQCLEATAQGAAYAAGLSVGVWSGIDEVRSNWLEDRRFEPAMGVTKREQLTRSWDKAVKRSLNWIDDYEDDNSSSSSDSS